MNLPIIGTRNNDQNKISEVLYNNVVFFIFRTRKNPQPTSVNK